MFKYTQEEYKKSFPEDDVTLGAECIDGEVVDVECVYISEDEECPYIGYKYSNGQYWIYGARADQRVEGEDEIKEWLALT